VLADNGVKSGKTGLFRFRWCSGNWGEFGYSSTYRIVLETNHTPGSVIQIRAHLTNDLFTDTGNGGGQGNGNGRYGLNSFQVAAGSDFTDNNPKLTDGTTLSTFVSQASTGSYVGVDGSGPTPMIAFCPAAPGDGSATGVFADLATPWLTLTTVARRDGAPGSVLYMQIQAGGGGASSQHPRGAVNAGMTGMKGVAGIQRFRCMRYAGATSDWDNATDLDAGYMPAYFEVRSAQEAATHARVGDSTRIGTATTGLTTNAWVRAISALNAEQRGIVHGYDCWSCGGTAGPWFLGQAAEHLKNRQYLPRTVSFQCHSQNLNALTPGSPFTPGGIQADWVRVLESVTVCDELGIGVILETQQPTQYIQNIYNLGGVNQTNALAMETERVALNARIRASGRVVFDMDALLHGGVAASGIAYLKNSNGAADATGTPDGVHNKDLNENLLVDGAMAAIKAAMASTVPIRGTRPPRPLNFTVAADGAKTVFTFPHGMGAVPSDVSVTTRNTLSRSVPHTLSFDVNVITVTYDSAPAAGTLSFTFRTQY